MKKISILFVVMLLMSIIKTFAQSPCNAAYTWAVSPNTTSSLGITFTDNSTAAAGTNIWSYLYFGDGTADYLYGSYLYTYTTPGTYNTMLVIHTTDSASNTVCVDTAYQTVTVDYLPCAVDISAVENNDGSTTFTAIPLSGTTGMTYNWNFADGTTGTGSPVNHTFSASGYYTVALTATGAGCNSSDSIHIHHTDSSVVNCSTLSASFTALVSGLSASFTNTSPSASTAVVSQTDWYFGNGSAQSSGYLTANVNYNDTGTYTVIMVNHWVDSLTGQLLCVDSATQSIVVDGTFLPNVISGFISWDSSGAITVSDSFKVWLITYDSAANSLYAIDSTYASPNYAMYTFHNAASGNYWVKAALLNQPPGTAGLEPTYYTSSPYWSTATSVYHSGGYNTGRNIYMQNGTVTSGPGFIAGNISTGAGKGTGTGVADLLVYLRGPNNALIASTITDINGDYSFSNIPAGTYNVYPELMNYQTTPFNAIAVTAVQESVSAIDFEKSGNEIKPKNKPTSIAIIGKEDGLSVYPNPAKNQLLIESKNGLFNKVVIVNTLGQSIQENKLTNGINKINLSAINSGIYYLLISGADQTRSMKIIKE